ncbi:MAG TPA: DNA cytosine methyltransferase [Gemmataceae bacterium]|nr:DNA cytosine methyltransferase [Gemmataceae bacterium]
MDQRKRVLILTPGNLRQNHFYIREHLDFFPPDCFGPAKLAGHDPERSLEILLDGLNEVITTDIGTDKRTGKPRAFFRGRTWVRRFFQHHNVNAGDRLALECLGSRRYRLSVERATGGSSLPAVAEFFAGVGLVRLALERQGWRVVFANDIDPNKAEMYRQNWPNDLHLMFRRHPGAWGRRGQVSGLAALLGCGRHAPR